MESLDLNTLKKSRLVHLCLGITFFTSGIIVNLLQCLLFVTIHPFNKYLYRKINWYLCYTVYAQLVFLGDWWSNSEVKLYIDKDDYEKYYGKEHAFCVMNHSYDVDWLIGWMIADKIKLLGNCKAYAKKVVQYIPVLGWGWKASEFVFLERSFDKDKDIINRQIKELADHPDPMWLLLFPEGTRFTPEKQKAAVEFARKSGHKELQYHLIPRTKGFIASLPSMQGKVPAIYDIELAFKEDDPNKPTITNMLFGKKLVAHIYMHRIPMEEVPKTEPEQDKFLRDMFERKDKIRDSFVKTGDFFATSGVKRVEPFTRERNTIIVINCLVWNLVILIPIIKTLLKLFFSGELLYFSIGSSIIIAFYLLMIKTIGMSKIEKGSSYGKDTPKKTK